MSLERFNECTRRIKQNNFHHMKMEYFMNKCSYVYVFVWTYKNIIVIICELSHCFTLLLFPLRITMMYFNTGYIWVNAIGADMERGKKGEMEKGREREKDKESEWMKWECERL